MAGMKKHRLNLLNVLIIIIFISSKSLAEENVSDSPTDGVCDNSPDAAMPKNAKSDDGEQQLSVKLEHRSDSSKLDKSDLPSQNVDEKCQNSKNEENNQPIADSKHKVDIEEGNNLRSEAKDDKDHTNAEDRGHASGENSSKQDNSKAEENNQPPKTSLSDVNAYKEEDGPKTKREAGLRESYSEFLGLPRDASYFFDDLEPFINNSSESRVGRAASMRETKVQKGRLSGKGKDAIGDDILDDEEEEEGTSDEDEQKQSEDDYDDDDEEMDSDCSPTVATTDLATDACTTKPDSTTKPSCTKSTTTTPCPTTTTCATTTTCPTTKKCTTPQKCPSKCKTPTTTPPACCEKAKNQDDETGTGQQDDKKLVKNIKRRLHSREKINQKSSLHKKLK